MTDKTDKRDKDGAVLAELNSSDRKARDKGDGETGASVLSEINDEPDDRGKDGG